MYPSLWLIKWHATESRGTLGISGVVRGESALFMRHDTFNSPPATGLLQEELAFIFCSHCEMVGGFCLLETDHPLHSLLVCTGLNAGLQLKIIFLFVIVFSADYFLT